MSGAGTPTYPGKTIAKLLMLTDRRVQQLAKEGVIPKAERGRYELAPAVQGYIRYLQDRAAGSAVQSGTIDYHVEKARKTKAEADIAEIEAAKRRGDAIDAAEVKRAWQLILGEVRANLLGNTPQRITSLVLGLNDEAQIKRVIRDEIALAMSAAAETDVEELFADG
ncbi:terminase small subunit, Nu1 [Sulfitobacter sp. 1A15106]|uniref:terminase small subunit, Nu1 n=1 Tax=Sulfitobacter sp. 1A15106 TaxID=3368590 RepID=UPI003744C12E